VKNKNLLLLYKTKKLMVRHSRRYSSESSSESSYSSDSDCSRRSSRSSHSSSSGSSVNEKELKHDLDQLENRFNCKIKKMYHKFLWHLRRDPCLMVNGSDCYGSFYSTIVHSIPVGDNFPLDNQQNVLNILYNPGDSFFVVQRSGLYFYSWILMVDQPCQVGVAINDVVDNTTIVANNSGANVTSGVQTLALRAGDKVAIKNWKSTSTLSTTFAAAGDQTLPSVNVDITIFRIAPYPGDCCPPPLPFPKTECHEEPHEPHSEDEKPHCHPHPPTPPCPPKKTKCDKKFEEIDKNKDGVVTKEEFCENYSKKHKKHRRHRKHRRD